MKYFSAAVAAIVVVGVALTGSPAWAEGMPTSAQAVTVDPIPAVPNIGGPDIRSDLHPLNPAFDIDSGATSGQSLQPQARSESSTASISGHVVSAFGDGEALPAVHVRAVLFDDDGNIKFQQQTTTDDTGAYTIGELAPADYWIEFYDATNFPNPTYQWWGSSWLNVDGKTIPVTDGAAAIADWQLTPAAQISGQITCEGCSSPPDPAQTTVVFESKYNGDYTFIAAVTPDSSGAYDTSFLYPADYVTLVVWNGGGQWSKYSNSPEYLAVNYAPVVSNVIIAKHINAVAGIDPQVNAVVSALYSDFLNRTPAASEVQFWGSRLQAGAGPEIVAAGFVNSDEYRLIRIDAAYQSILGRAGEEQGRQDNLQAMRTGVITTDGIETAFYASGEYYSAHGGTDSSFITAIYSALLHRVAGPSEIASWKTQIQKHSRPWVIQQIWDANETISERVSLMYQKYLGRIPDDQGLKSWVALALQIGDSGLRAGLTGSQEYLNRAQYRFDERVFD